jgi:Zn-finger in ubiquitin-hydrolases and other protein
VGPWAVKFPEVQLYSCVLTSARAAGDTEPDAALTGLKEVLEDLLLHIRLLLPSRRWSSAYPTPFSCERFFALVVRSISRARRDHLDGPFRSQCMQIAETLMGVSVGAESIRGMPPNTINRFDIETWSAHVTFTVGQSENPMMCSHGHLIRDVQPSGSGCLDCLQLGDTWLQLRMCMACGHVGCCDSSKNKHASRHFGATQHPITRSIEPGETWAWCYLDRLWFERLVFQ